MEVADDGNKAGVFGAGKKLGSLSEQKGDL